MTRSLALLFACLLTLAPAINAQEIKETNSIKETFGVTALAVSSDGKSLAFADKDNELLLRPVSGTRRIAIGKHSAVFVSLAFSGDGKKIAALTTDRLVQVWDAGKSEADKPITTYKVEPAAGLVAFGADGKVVLAYVVSGRAGDDNFAEIRLLDVATGKHRVISKATTPVALPGISANFRLLALSADAKALAVTSTDPGGTAKQTIVNTATGQMRNVPASIADNPILAVSDGGIVLVTAGKNGLQCWNYAAAQTWSSDKTSARLATVSADGRTVVTVDAGNVVTTYETPGSAGQVKPDPKKVNPDRLRGMKAALVDIEKGQLKEKMEQPLTGSRGVECRIRRTGAVRLLTSGVQGRS